MKNFSLSSSYIVKKNLLTEVCLKPSDPNINMYLEVYRVYDTEQDALNDLNNFIAEQTPILYNIFNGMDNVSQEIRSSYQL